MAADSLSAYAARDQAVTPSSLTIARPLLSSATDRRLRTVATISLGVTLLGWFLDREGVAGGLLVASQFGLGLAVGSLAFVVLGHILGAGWNVAIRRVPEALAGALPIASILVILAVLMTLPVYEWNHADVVEKDALLRHKSLWLNPGAFVARTLGCLGLWCLFAWLIRRTSQAQDAAGSAKPAKRIMPLSTLFVAVLAVTWSITSFDWMMSLEPHWFSTVYAIYTFSSAFVSALAAIVLLALLLEWAGPLRGVLRSEHLHDLGKLLFGFATFWAYIWFCQYMLIWYSNIPEETAYFVRRTSNGWTPFLLATLAVMWLVPFLSLLSRLAKRSRVHMARIAVVVLIGRWLDLHVLVMPSIKPQHPWALLWELTALVGVLALVLWATLRAYTAARPVPENDPYLAESLGYHT